MKILSVSDVELGSIYNAQITQRFPDVDLVISCGDLSYFYLEYIISTLNKPLYFVRGNHAVQVEYGVGGERKAPWGAVDLHERAVYEHGLLMAGVQGSLQYNFGPYQYTQGEMWAFVLGLAPRLMLNRLQYGRYLDIFVTHASPWGVHDMEDLPHRGIKAFNWLIKVFKPTLHLHGHIHIYRPDVITETLVNQTRVINTYGFRETIFDPPALK